MLIDKLSRPIRKGGFDQGPFGILPEDVANQLANIEAILLLENGTRAAREAWQQAQLRNLLKHAHARSAFWRARMPSSRMINHAMLPYMPVLSREDVRQQCAQEGSLVPAPPGQSNQGYSSTGSTGVPVRVFLTPENGYYVQLRSLAQYFVYDFGFDEDRVQIVPPIKNATQMRSGPKVDEADSWIGVLSKLFVNGSSRKITHNQRDDQLLAAFSSAPAAYLSSGSRYVEVLLALGGPELFRKMGTKVWLHMSDYRSPDAVAALKSVGVICLSNYSAGEMGPIAYECKEHEGHFHVAHSNVIVEADETTSVEFNGTKINRLLITHLHSYATPLVRYDVGDFGSLAPTCPCGHDGPTLSNIYGRGKHFLRHPKGHLMPLYLSTRLLLEAVHFTECRLKQTAIDKIVVDLGGRDSITDEEAARLRATIHAASDHVFEIEIRPVREIDWSDGPKRLLFVSEVA